MSRRIIPKMPPRTACRQIIELVGMSESDASGSPAQAVASQQGSDRIQSASAGRPGIPVQTRYSSDPDCGEGCFEPGSVLGYAA